METGPERPKSSAGSSYRALLLNSSYEPMRIISWQKAIILFFQGKVEVVEYHGIFVRSVRSSFQVPSILRLKTYIRPRSYGAVRFCRENVYIRDNYTCQYCGDKLPGKLLTLDHVVPASQKGPKTWSNVVAACKQCNQRKGNRTPQAANMPLLSEPKIPHWLPSTEFQITAGSVPQTWIEYLQFKVG